jgi:tagatose 1,6-diphosphate aldolase
MLPHLANELGIDMLKAEFPGDVSTPAGQAAADACKRLAAGISVAWVILSAGVGYEQFRERVRIAAGAGSCGFPAGRSIWHDAASVHDPAKRAAAVADAAKRLDELTAITRAARHALAAGARRARPRCRVPERLVQYVAFAAGCHPRSRVGASSGMGDRRTYRAA